MWYTPFIEYDQYERLKLNPNDPKTWPPPKDLKVESGPRKNGLLYAYSQDGLKWVKPKLGLAVHRGSNQNNIVQIGGEGEDLAGPGVQLDPLETDPAKRYKMVYGVTHPHGVGNQGLGVAFSSDGMRWHSHQRVLGPKDWPTIYGDAHNGWIRSPATGRYVAFTQSWTDWSCSQRIKLRTESEDFIHWTPPEQVRYDPDAEVHTHVPFVYNGSHMALLHMVTTKDGLGDGTIDMELGWSGDTRVWRRVAPDQHLIERGPAGEIDCGCVFGALKPIVRDGHIHLYYCANDATIRGWRKGYWCLATLPIDRWASITAEDPKHPPQIMTLPSQVDVAQMTLNAKTQKNGHIVLRTRAINGTLLGESEPITGDDAAIGVRWKKPPSKQTPFRINFELKNAELFAYSLN